MNQKMLPLLTVPIYPNSSRQGPPSYAVILQNGVLCKGLEELASTSNAVQKLRKVVQDLSDILTRM
jgi:hypothetical protein